MVKKGNYIIGPKGGVAANSGVSGKPGVSSHCASLDLAKAIMLCGVIMIHTDPFLHAERGSVLVSEVFDMISTLLTFCVPFFFIISGYLFFANVERLDLGIYGRKLRSRVWSLLIPYLLWNTIFAIVRFLKAKYLGYEGDGICVEGEFSPLGFLQGFWNTGDDYPADFPLWFLRNLIVFQLITPVIAVVGRYWVLVGALVLVPVLGADWPVIELWGVEYFAFGAALGIHKINLEALCPRRAGLLLLACVVLALVCGEWCPRMLPIVRCVAILIFIPVCRDCLKRFRRISGFVVRKRGAFFFIYAVHAICCALMTRMSIGIVGCGNLVSALLCFMLAFSTTMGVSVVLFAILGAIWPYGQNLLSGMRMR